MRVQTAEMAYMRKGEGQRKREKIMHEKHVDISVEQARPKIKPPVPTRQECMVAEKTLKPKADAHQDYIRKNALQAIRYACTHTVSSTLCAM